jgi:arylsulfatase A-like enzyme
MYNDKAWMAGTSGRNFSFIYRMIDAVGLGAVDDKGGAKVVDNIQNWMEDRPQDGPPNFVFVNFFEAHFPFRQLPRDFRDAYQNASANTLREIDQIAFGVQFGRQLTDEEMDFVHQPLIDLYDGGVLYTDHLVGEVIDVWRKAGRLDNTVVVILGDHGEVVGEHGAFGHVTPVLEQDLRVPFVVRYPERIPANSKVEMPVSTVGTFGTIMDLVDVEPPPILQVSSLMPGLDGEIVGLPILAERFEEEMLAARFEPGTANGTGEQVNPHGRYRTYRSGPYKLVQHTDDGTFLFNLETDPGEHKDIAKTQPDVVAELEEELADWSEQLGLPELDAPIDAPRDMPENIGDAEIEALQALGYME